MTPLIAERAGRLATLHLERGGHATFGGGVCATEALAWLAGEDHTDHPMCASPVLATFLRRWNDDLDDEGRQKLKPFLLGVVGTAGDGKDELRGWLAGDWLIRVHTPAWLELAGVAESAVALRSLPPLRDLKLLEHARPTIDEARSKGAAAGDAAWAAAWNAAWNAARDAAWAAAWAAARDAAWAAARAAAGDAAWAAARAAAWAAAGDAAGDAAWAAARAAARAAAGDALRPTSESLQASALDLLDRMIDPEESSNGA